MIVIINLNRLDNENEEQYIFRLGQAKDSGNLDLSWNEIADLINKEFREDESEYRSEAAYRKPFQQAKRYYESNVFGNILDEDKYFKELQLQKEQVRKERIKLQTANVERNRLDRAEARQEFFYEYIGSVKETLPLPDFCPLNTDEQSDDYEEQPKEYMLMISDIHFGACFESENNSYSPEIFRDRLEFLTENIFKFIEEKKLNKLHIFCLGDVLQGIIRVSDLKINDSSIVKSTVEISRLLAMFLNSISKYVDVEYYHVPSSNHTQLRPIGTKASELMDEDLEYIIGNYIKDLCSNNDRINVNLAEDHVQYIETVINGFNIIAMHGHQIRNIENALKDLSFQKGTIIDYLFLGHFHAGKNISVSEGCTGDIETYVCPSFVGSDPYSDSIMRGSKAAVKIFGIDYIYGINETYKIILN